jgi:hypothetical protein
MPIVDVKPVRKSSGERVTLAVRREAADRLGKRVFRPDEKGAMASGPPLAPRAPGKAGRLPSWSELASAGGAGRAAKARANAFVESISTQQFVLIILVLATAFTLYINHVNATQEVASELQQLRRENLRLHLKYNRLKGEFDTATGPAAIYQRAEALGLEEGYSYGPTIVVE